MVFYSAALLYCHRDPFDLRAGLVIFHNKIIHGKVVKLLYVRIDSELWRRIPGSADQFLYQGDVPVVDMGVRDHMNKFPNLQTAHLGKHMHQNRILHNVERIGDQNVLGPLVQYGVQSVFRDIEVML